MFNLSRMELSRAQMEVLSRGPNFGLPPGSVCKEGILGEFELYYDKVDHLMSSSTSPESKEAFRNKLRSLAHEYANIKQDRNAFPLGRERMEAIRELRSRKDIIIPTRVQARC